jgi:hypothetical protein
MKLEAKKGDKLLWKGAGKSTHIGTVGDIDDYGIELKDSDSFRMIHWSNVLEIYKPETHPEYFI